MVFGKMITEYPDRRVQHLHSTNRVVVKVSDHAGFKHEISLYLQEDGRVDCVYYPSHNMGSTSIFSGALLEDELVIDVNEEWNN
jgi:hypothetical protein